MSIVVATTNPSKLAEIRSMLADLPVEVLSGKDALGDTPSHPVEANTLEENALRKARAAAEVCMALTIADDSGLEVDALGGQPGVRSARFAREGATDAENNTELLTRLADLDNESRGARFRVAMALIDPWSPEKKYLFEGICPGRIAHKPAGTGGFGYDPLFVVTGLERTIAELAQGEKTLISHRVKALEKLQPILQSIIVERISQADAILVG